MIWWASQSDIRGGFYRENGPKWVKSLFLGLLALQVTSGQHVPTPKVIPHGSGTLGSGQWPSIAIPSGSIAQNGSKMEPKWTMDGSKNDEKSTFPKPPQNASGRSKMGSESLRITFWTIFFVPRSPQDRKFFSFFRQFANLWHFGAVWVAPGCS